MLGMVYPTMGEFDEFLQRFLLQDSGAASAVGDRNGDAGVMFGEKQVPLFVDLIGLDIEVGEIRDSEGGGNGDVGGVASDGHEDPADAGVVVARVHGPPATFKEDLVPGGEIARAGVGRADVAEVSGDISGGEVHCAGEGDRKMLEVTADADTLG